MTHTSSILHNFGQLPNAYLHFKKMHTWRKKAACLRSDSLDRCARIAKRHSKLWSTNNSRVGLQRKAFYAPLNMTSTRPRCWTPKFESYLRGASDCRSEYYLMYVGTAAQNHALVSSRRRAQFLLDLDHPFTSSMITIFNVLIRRAINLCPIEMDGLSTFQWASESVVIRISIRW